MARTAQDMREKRDVSRVVSRFVSPVLLVLLIPPFSRGCCANIVFRSLLGTDFVWSPFLAFLFGLFLVLYRRLNGSFRCTPRQTGQVT
jgi:hypothetical protein